jgi:ketosteroid isomerase-like protein
MTFFFAACSTEVKETTTVDMAKLKTDIQALEDAFAAGEKAKDANAVVAYYSDDAISYQREKPALVGKAAIKEDIAKDLATDSTGNHNVYKVVDLFAEGDMAVEVGSWTRVDTAGATVNNGHYLSYFQKRDGKYLCVRDMSVRSNPPKQVVKAAE